MKPSRSIWYFEPVSARTGCLLLLLLPALARATEGESALSFAPVFAVLNVTQHDRDAGGPGVGLVVDYQIGLSDSFAFRAAAGGSAHAVSGERAFAATGTAGITYAIDVFRYVPYVGAGLGVAVVGGGPVDRELKGYLELGVGVDVLQGRSWSWGIDARLSSFVSGLQVFTIGPKLSIRWGYF